MKKDSQKEYLGELPLELINHYLQMELEHEGKVVLSSGAKRHIFKRHKCDYEKYFHLLSEVVTNPTFIGDDHNNRNKIELIKRIDEDKNILLAISLERKNKEYHVSSFYCISKRKLDSRISKGFLKRVI